MPKLWQQVGNPKQRQRRQGYRRGLHERAVLPLHQLKRLRLHLRRVCLFLPLPKPTPKGRSGFSKGNTQTTRAAEAGGLG